MLDNFEFLKSVNQEDKQRFLQELEGLINQTYIVEQEYKNLTTSYNDLQGIIKGIVESLPNAVWVLEKDGSVFLQNSEAKALEAVFSMIDLQKRWEEIEYDNHFYIIRLSTQIDKTIVTATDITEQRRKERLASMGQVSAHLAHEIRNPIGSVALLASTLMKKVDLSAKPLVFEIKKSIWRVERIIKATLLFSKGLNTKRELVSLGSVKRELEGAVEFYDYSKDIEFEYNFPHSQVYIDLDLFSIVLQNFVYNAIDAIEEDEDSDEGKVVVEYKEERDESFFYVYDTGKPIENKNILFEPFKSTKTKGHGLGLALSMQIVKAHGGNIELLENKKGFVIKITKS
ncbi:MAG: sensor histidine kinase [Campylobacterales bacterium]